MKLLNELQKVQLLENTVLSADIEELRTILETYSPFEFTARALGIAARSRGLAFVEELVHYGATFRYHSTSVLNRRYGMYVKGGTSSGVHYSQYDLLLVADKRDLPVFNCFQMTMEVLPLEDRLAVVQFLTEHPELGASLDQILFYALITGELDFADALMGWGINLQNSPPSYYASHILEEWWANPYGNDATYLDILTQGIQSIYWSTYVDALAVKNEEELLPILSRFHNIAAASGKKLMFTKGAFSNLKWNDESLHFAMEHIDLSRVDQKLILETAVLKAGSATLAMIATQGWITKADKIEKLIKLAQDNNRTEALSWLLDYKNRTVDIAAETVKAEAKMKQQLAENPNSLAAMKKIWKFTKQEDGTIRIDGYKGQDTDVFVPAQIGTDPVVAISKHAFSPNASNIRNAKVREKLTSIQIPLGVVSLEKEAFSGCCSLVSISIPETVTDIRSDFFELNSCNDLSYIEIYSHHISSGCLWWYVNPKTTQIIAPFLTPDIFYDENTQFSAVLGFLNDPEKYTDPNVVAAYRKYALTHKEKLLSIIFARDMKHALVFYTTNCKILAARFRSEYLLPATKANAVGCIAYLTEWCEMHLSKNTKPE